MAGFNTAISGIRAATAALDVTGNNIANASTTGFKSSRTEFADIYATAAIGSGASNTPGSGVLVSDIAQDFSGGNVQFTNNNLDLSIDGSGFFQLDDGRGTVTYTRDGSFELDKNGFIVSKGGQNLQGYGVDDQGNRLPIDNLRVNEKESPPKATETMALSFNINEALDAESLIVPYSREEPGSTTFSTTVGTFDSLGNEHTLRYDMVEQQAKKEVHTFDHVLGAAGEDLFQLSGVILDPDAAGTDFAAGVISPDKLQALQIADPRIKNVEYVSATAAGAAGAGKIIVTLKSSATDVGDLVVGAGGGVLPTNEQTDLVASNETHTYTIPAGLGGALPGVSGPAGVVAGDQADVQAAPPNSYVFQQSFSIAGIAFDFPATPSEPITRKQVADEIISQETAIRDADPNIESISFNEGTNELKITYKAESGNVNPTAIAQTAGNFFGGTAGTATAVAVPTAAVVEEGDNSYQGVYRMYAYLNPLGQRPEALDIGKVVDAGSSLGTASEIGPVIVKFNPANGVMTSINGEDIPTTVGASVPKLIIKGADPADGNTTISLDLAGTTQFADTQIVKAQSQDGYSKGDLTGVAFTPTGEMIATFSNNQSQTLGIVAVATFENQAGMQPNGSTQWLATNASGNPVLNPPGSGLNGSLRSSALESSNVDLSAELVKLIESQRNFQASSKTLETLNTVTQNILQI
ncbi:MAG: flagellar hook-basal body complex protein [Oceanospirillaceae bacterium]